MNRARPRTADPTRVGLATVLPLSRGELFAALGLALAYGAVSVASLYLLFAPSAGVTFWPAAGLAFAALVVGGARLWPGVLVGHLLALVTLEGAVEVNDLWVAGASTLAAVVPALAFRRLRLDPNLASLNAILVLVLGGGLLGATISAGLGAPLVAPEGEAARLGATWWFGHLAGVLAVAPVVLTWRRGGGPALAWPERLHLAAALLVTVAVAYAIFVWVPPQVLRSWYIFPILVWPALAFSVRGASAALLGLAVVAFAGVIEGIGPFNAAPDGRAQVLLAQQFVSIVSATVLILAAVADERRGREQLQVSERRLRDESEALEILNRTGAAVAAQLDLDTAVQTVTDSGRALSGAQIGAFFYNVIDEVGERFTLFALSGAPRAAFERFGHPRNTAVFAPTFSGEGVVRVADITQDARYGQNPPNRGMPEGHPPFRSYLAVPVRSRSGEIIGGLFFGHEDAGVFTVRAERLIVGLANQAAVAIDNARLYQAAQREIAERRRAEEHQRLLMNELNHRVKNTLATVQSMGAQTMRSDRTLSEAREAFVSRLMALSAAHNLLTAESWESADLEDVVRLAVAAFDEPQGGRFSISGPGARLKASHALGLAMALHELGSNAVKYGALSDESGRVSIDWTLTDDLLRFVWREVDGPAVQPPLRRGFGSRLIQEGLARELNGQVRMDYLPEGLSCELSFRLDRAEQAGLEVSPETDADVI
ncbi:HWE histidine kinase domain-containing protein [Phenylobacterium sp.]|uniref:HWE histidine kinase domain-containing protein n=1 Tax=Phenylobacterium sp. TaxID=1871053 RepID=UPI003D291ACB